MSVTIHNTPDGFYHHFYKGVPIPAISLEGKHYIMASFVKLFVNDKIEGCEPQEGDLLTLDPLQLMYLQINNPETLEVRFGYDTEFWSYTYTLTYLAFHTSMNNCRVMVSKKLRHFRPYKNHYDLITSFPEINLDIFDTLEILCDSPEISRKRKLDEGEESAAKKARLY